MTKISYPANSAYFTTPQTANFIGRWVFRPIPPDSGDSLFTLQPQHQYRPDRLSFDLYNNPSLWWIFSVRNPFLRADPVWNFTNGLTIVVPSTNYLYSTLGL